LHLQNQNAVAVPLAEEGPHRHIAFVTRLNYARVDDISLLGEVFNKAFKDAANTK
ncbi:MAG: hydrogen peroxide-inducible genes activator, partial [Pseudomonadota bacterium]|nr:hydrogen peroxide-inducible genes activator [Pseudomonadota bacterium]